MSATIPGLSELSEVRVRLQACRHIVALTGAGVSAESGVPTFRDAQTGLWSRFEPEELATEAAFRSDPARVWDWYAWRRTLLATVRPNAGHEALAQFARRHPGRLSVVTQNVDGLHQAAGSDDVLALHGTLAGDRWLDACPLVQSGVAGCDPQEATAGHPPRCTTCGNLVRPDVVWFGEPLPEGVLARAGAAARDCDAMLVVGTSGAVYPAAGLAEIADAAGALVVVVNPAASELDRVAGVRLRGTSAAILPPLLDF